jgi:hypothetical protein
VETLPSAPFPPPKRRVARSWRLAVEAGVLVALLTGLGASAAWSALPPASAPSPPAPHRLAAAPLADAPIPLRDSNGNGVPDVAKNARYSIGLDGTDTDGDGIPDGWEVHFGLDPNDAAQARQDPTHSGMTLLAKYQWSAQRLATVGGDGAFDPALGLDPRRADTNGDGLPDGWKVRYGLDPLGANLTAVRTPSGLTYLEAYQHGTDPTKADTVGNGLSDYDKVHTYHTDPRRWSTAGDGIPDGWKVFFGLDPTDPSQAVRDAAGSGMTILEKYQWSAQRLAKPGGGNGTFDPALGLDPLKADTNGDGLPDGWKVLYGLDPLGPSLAGQLTPSGLTFLEAYQDGLDPTRYDTVGNGLSDFEKVHVYHTDPRKWSTVGDGISDGDKVHKYHLDPRVLDTDGDGLTDCQEVLDSLLAHCTDGYQGPHDGGTRTDARRADSSGGGIPDGRAWQYWSLRAANCTRDPGAEANLSQWVKDHHPQEGPLALCARYGPLGDLLGAGVPNILNPAVAGNLTNGQKLALHLDLAHADTDRDGLPDAWEVQMETDPLRPDADEWVASHGAVLVYRGGDRTAYASPSHIPDEFRAAAPSETFRYTNRMAYADGTDPRTLDGDCDGIPDAWESYFHHRPGMLGLDPTASDADQDWAVVGLSGAPDPGGHDLSGYDADGDGHVAGGERLTAFEKWWFALDPTRASSHPAGGTTDGQRLWEASRDAGGDPPQVGLPDNGAGEKATARFASGCA